MPALSWPSSRRAASAQAARTFARDPREMPRDSQRQRSREPADLLDAPCAASAASHRVDRITDAGVLPVTGDESRDRDVARMSAAARDPERAAAQAAQPPPFEAQLAVLPGGGLGMAGA